MFAWIMYRNEEQEPGTFHPGTRHEQALSGSTNKPLDHGDAEYTGIVFPYEEEQRLLKEGVLGPDGEYNPADYFDPIQPDLQDPIARTRIAVSGSDLPPFKLPKITHKREIPQAGFIRDEKFEIKILSRHLHKDREGRMHLQLAEEQVQYLRDYFEHAMESDLLRIKALEEEIALKESVHHPRAIIGLFRKAAVHLRKDDPSTKKEPDTVSEKYRTIAARAKALSALREGDTTPAVVQFIIERLNGYVRDYSRYLAGDLAEHSDFYWRKRESEHITMVQERASIEFKILHDLSPEDAKEMHRGTLLDLRAREALFGR